MTSWLAVLVPAQGGSCTRKAGEGAERKSTVAAAAMADEEEDPPFEEDTEEAGGGPDGGQGKRKRLFSKEHTAEDSLSLCRSFGSTVRCMMYGFGDDQNPYTESVDILEDLVIEFITEMTHKAMSIGRQGRVQVEDIVFLIRKDPRKFARVKDLLTMNEELKRARKAFDEANYGS
ncbi:hypothetical protein lerEdw1_012433 [Lerista edwardsae]|nr:hypothetical protein lerEdw1_012433 [Lerista edwardsae]